MSELSVTSVDWAQDIAERIVGDIPHTVFVKWATDVPERVAARLRAEYRIRSTDGEINAFVEGVVRSLPNYLPSQGAARMRAKLLAALMVAGALGEHLRGLDEHSAAGMSG